MAKKTKPAEPPPLLQEAEAPAAAHVLGPRFADPDLVDRIFDYVVELIPALAGREHEIKDALRDEFKGERVFIRSEQRARVARQVLSMFNGRNATEVARKLDISRASVYRYIKQAGGASGR